MAQKGTVDENLRRLLMHFRSIKEESSVRTSLGERTTWLRPPLHAWNGSVDTLTAWAAMHTPFNTDEAEESLIRVHDVEDPGNVGDDIALTLQISYASQAERAYRSRVSQSFPRSVAHVVGRERGHGHPNGVLATSLLRYVDDVLQQSANTISEPS